MQDILSPQDLAKQTTDEIIESLESENSSDVLAAIQRHYDILNKTQGLQIEFLSEFIQNLKNLQQKDKASLDALKQQVISHILKK